MAWRGERSLFYVFSSRVPRRESFVVAKLGNFIFALATKKTVRWWLLLQDMAVVGTQTKRNCMY